MRTAETRIASTTTQKWVLALTAIASLMVALDVTVVATALSTIRKDLGASVESLEWTVNAYNLSFAVLLMTAAALGDRLGRRRMLVAGLALFTVASAACALAPGIGVLIAARVVQGVGGALIMPHAMALLGAAFPADRRAWALGIFGSVTGLAVVGGPLVGGAVTEGIAWPWIFWLNVPLGLVMIPLVRARVAESVGAGRRLDVAGLLLVTAGAFGLVWGVVRGNAAGWGSAEVVSAIAAGALFTIGFLRWELRAREPMLPLRFFRTPAFSAGNAAGFFMHAALGGSVFFIAQFLQTVLGYGPLGAGLRLVPWTATLFIVSPIAGSWIRRIGERPLIVGGLLMQATGFGAIALLAGRNLSFPDMIAPLIIAGCGVSMAMPAAQNAAMGAVPPGAIGKASGTYSTMRQLGSVFGVAIPVAVFAATGSFASAGAFTDGFGPAMAVTTGLSVLAALAGLAAPGRRRIVLPTAEPVRVPVTEPT